jgi:aryl-alcohol dehydrogenase-like predicted oxidoreductase
MENHKIVSLVEENLDSRARYLVLGTANFGNSYGINSDSGDKPVIGRNSALELFETAIELGIVHFDTAKNYGPSLSWLSDFSKNHNVKIRSKISVAEKSYPEIIRDLEDHIRIFQAHDYDCLEMVQFHNWTGNKREIQILNDLYTRLDIGLENRLGATTYGSTAAISALKYFDCIQIEWNILNQKTFLTVQDFAQNQKLKPKKLSIRSILLQGLLGMDLHQIPTRLRPLNPYLSSVNQMIDDSGLDKVEFLVRSFHNLSDAESLVIGVENPIQLRQIHRYFNAGPLPSALFSKILSFRAINHTMVDPRNW